MFDAQFFRAFLKFESFQMLKCFSPHLISDVVSTVSVSPAGGAQRTPVRQKMKTMSRSLQMLNFARLNVKAQKSHTDPEAQAGGSRGGGPERALTKRRSGDQARTRTSSDSISKSNWFWIILHVKIFPRVQGYKLTFC